jgi:hypothetical protein
MVVGRHAQAVAGIAADREFAVGKWEGRAFVGAGDGPSNAQSCSHALLITAGRQPLSR